MNAPNVALKGGLNGALGYTRLDLRRTLRDRGALFFIVVLPVFMYLVFGVGGDESVGSGNVAMYVAISMAAYGLKQKPQRKQQLQRFYLHLFQNSLQHSFCIIVLQLSALE